MDFRFFQFLKEKNKIPRKRSQSEDTGLKRKLNESYWVRFGIVFLSTSILSFILKGILFTPYRSLSIWEDLFPLFSYLFILQALIQLYFSFFERKIFTSNKKQLMIESIVILTVLLQIVVMKLKIFQEISFRDYIFFEPFGIMLLTLFVGVRVSLLFSFILGIYFTLIEGLIPEAVLVIPICSAFSALFIKDVRNRYHMTRAGIYTTAIAFFLLMVVHFISGTFVIQNIKDYALGSIGTGIFSVMLIFVFLYFFEIIFSEVTSISLLELSDLNHPLLKELLLNAPGTYHHSITVSNLGEAAAEAIGARSLLVRVMAYYHDIGKLIMSEYFSENELGGKSLHGELSSSMSSLIIISHVKNGIDIAKKHKLPAIVIDGIKEHHGTSLVYFFYKRAQDEATNKDIIKEENYRYPGPKPRSRETAILSVADVIEAASRSLADPSPSRIRSLVQELLQDKYTSGELDECNLTFKELKTIEETFIRMMTARFHRRPVYPDKTSVS
jgi:cyclic-di-AMP phosphodiesterase PgpH